MTNCSAKGVEKCQQTTVLTVLVSKSAALAKVNGSFDQVKENVEKKLEKCPHFSIRGYVNEMRQKDVTVCRPFSNSSPLEPLDMPRCCLCERGVQDIVICGATTDLLKWCKASPHQLNGDGDHQLRENRALKETNTPGKEADKRSRKVVRINNIAAAVKNSIDTDDRGETITGILDNERLRLGDTRISGFLTGESSVHSRLHEQDLLGNLNARITKTTNILHQQQHQNQNSTSDGINLDLSLGLSSSFQEAAIQPQETALLNPSSDESITKTVLLSLNSGPLAAGPQDTKHSKGCSPFSGSQFQIPNKRAKSTGTAETSGASASNLNPKSSNDLVCREVNRPFRHLKESPDIGRCMLNRKPEDFTSASPDNIYMINGAVVKPGKEGSRKRRLDQN